MSRSSSSFAQNQSAFPWDKIPPALCSFNQALISCVQENPNRLQYIAASGSKITLGGFYELSRSVAKSLVYLGLEPSGGVSIMGSNSIEWFAADVGAMLAAGIPTGIYTTNKSEIVGYICRHSKSKIVFLDDEMNLRKVVDEWDKCPELKAIVVWSMKPDKNAYAKIQDCLYTWDEFIALGSSVPNSSLNELVQLAKPGTIAKLIYTSGTTGDPKAVMISNDNIISAVQMISSVIQVAKHHRIVSYLPVSHIAANSVDICSALLLGQTVTIARPDALKGSLVETLRSVQPTIFLGVPRVFEKIQEKMIASSDASSGLKRFIFKLARTVSLKFAEGNGQEHPLLRLQYSMAKWLVFSKIREQLGLGSCQVIVSTAAPLQKDTLEYFQSVDLPIYEVYGMSEATGLVSTNYPESKKGTSGKIMDCIEAKLLNENSSGEGELLFRGRNIFLGYLNDPTETRKAIDDEGFLHSGDLGKIDKDGFITITGRVKDLIVTAGGENVAPAYVEETLRTAMPAIKRGFVVGDKRKFISCLLIPYMNEDGILVGPAKKVNPSIVGVEKVIEDKTWNEYIEQGIIKANMHAVSNATKVRKYVIITKDFSVDGGELTPSLKVKRKAVIKKYEEKINQMYGI